MNSDVEQIRQSILPILARYGITKAAVFGSAAKGTCHADSDIDLLVEIGEDLSLLDFVGLKLDLEEALNRKVDLVEYGMIKPLLRDRILAEQKVIL
jgi:predicted nucleotidyltransferase